MAVAFWGGRLWWADPPVQRGGFETSRGWLDSKNWYLVHRPSLREMNHDSVDIRKIDKSVWSLQNM